MGVYWVNSLHGIAFDEDSSIANLVIATKLLLYFSFCFRSVACLALHVVIITI